MTRMRAVRSWPDGRTEESVLEAVAGAHRLRVRRPDGAAIERHFPGTDLAEALKQCPEITGLTAHDQLNIACEDVDVLAVLRNCFIDREPDRGLDDGIWPAGDHEFLWDDDEVNAEFEELLRLRWLTIDGERHAVLIAPGPTRVVAVSNGRVEPDKELIAASWYGESAVTSFEGTYSVGLLGNDLLLEHSGGDVTETSIAPVTTAELPGRLARWLSGWNLAPAFLVHVTGLAGLSAAEAESITTNGVGRTQSLSSFLDEEQTGQVVEELRADPGYRTFRDALADPDSTDGRALYARFRAVLAGEAEYIDILEEHL